MTAEPNAGVVAAGEGRQLGAGTTRPVVKVGPHNGSRMIGLLESELRPGAGFPGHSHEDHEEIFYVLAGEMEYRLDDKWVTASAGATVFVPPGTIHGFRNASNATARHLAIVGPAEAVTMIEELTRAAPEEMAAVLARYRSHPAP